MASLTPLIVRLLLVAVLAAFSAGCSAEAKKKRHLSRGDEYFKAGELEKAKIEYANVLKLDASNARAVRQMGLAWSRQGAPLRALPYLIKVRELEPENLEVRLNLAYGMAALRQFPEMRKEARAILKKEPTHEDATMLMIDIARTPEEISELETLVRAAPEGSAVPHLFEANVALRRRDLENAKAALDRALAAKPESAPVHMARGNLQLLLRKLDEAGAEFKKAAELSPVRSSARLRYAEFLSQRNQRKDADEWIAAVTSSAPDYIPAWTLRAQVAFTERRFDDALGHLQKVFAIDGANFDARLIEAQVQLAKGDVKKATELIEGLDKAYPGIPIVKYHLARSYLSSGKTAEATTALGEAISKAPDYVDAILLQARVQLRSGDVQAVINAMGELLKKQPELTQAQLILAEAYRSAGRLADAAQVLEAQARALPENPQPKLLLGLIQRQQGKVAEAKETFEALDRIVPDSLLPLSQLVDIDLKENDFERAIRRVEERIAKEPKSAGAFFLKGRIHAAQRDWAKAEAALLKAVELEPGFVTAYDALSGVYVSQDKLQQAIDQLNEVLRKNPENTRSLMLSGVVHAQLRQFEEARSAYEKLLGTSPEFPPALNNLAWLYAEHLNGLDKGYELAAKARALRPSDPIIADTLGWILFRRGQYQQSLALLREASAELSQNPEVSYHLGMAAYMMADKEQARKSLEAAAGADTQFPGKDEIASRLSQLKGGIATEMESVQELRKRVESQPKDTIAWLRLGEAYEAQGNTPEAIKAYEEALEINPKLVPALLKLANLHSASEQNRATALQLARSARELASGDPGVAATVGRIAFRSGSYALAFSLLEEGARGIPGDTSISYDLAWAAYALGRIGEARKHMTLVARQPSDGSLASDAETFLQLVPEEGKAPEAKPEEVAAKLSQTPNYVPALMQRGAAEEKANDRKAAISTYNAVLHRFPLFVPAQKRLASLYSEDDATLDQAYSIAVEARKSFPNDLDLAKTLGTISYKRGDVAYAAQLLEMAFKSSEFNAKDLYYLGMTRWQKKAVAEAKEALSAALRAGLAEPMAAEASRVLKQAVETDSR